MQKRSYLSGGFFACFPLKNFERWNVSLGENHAWSVAWMFWCVRSCTVRRPAHVQGDHLVRRSKRANSARKIPRWHNGVTADGFWPWDEKIFLKHKCCIRAVQTKNWAKVASKKHWQCFIKGKQMKESIPQQNPDSFEKSWELRFPSRAINLIDMNLWVEEGAGSVPSKVSRERIIDVAELLTSSFDELVQILVDDDPWHNAIVWIFEKLVESSIWKWNISENSSGLLISSWTPKITEESRLAFKRSEIFCIQDSNIFASSVSLECNWWIFTSAKPAIFFSTNMDFGRKDRDQAISCKDTWSMLFTACKLCVSLNSEIPVDDRSFCASMVDNLKQPNARRRMFTLTRSWKTS